MCALLTACILYFPGSFVLVLLLAAVQFMLEWYKSFSFFQIGGITTNLILRNFRTLGLSPMYPCWLQLTQPLTCVAFWPRDIMWSVACTFTRKGCLCSVPSFHCISMCQILSACEACLPPLLQLLVPPWLNGCCCGPSASLLSPPYTYLYLCWHDLCRH